MYYLKKTRQNTTYMVPTEFTWDSLIARVKHPPILESKEFAGQVIFGSCVQNPEMTDFGRMRCVGNNVESLFALQLDYESSVTIDEWIENNKEWKFILYTSYSYGSPQKPGDRFRVILPLDEPYQMSTHNPLMKADMVMHFHDCDKTCFDRGHFQNLPCVSSVDAPYRYHINDGGVYFDLFNPWYCKQRYETYQRQLAEKLVVAETKRSIYNPDNKSGALRFAQQQIDDAVEGSRDTTLYNMLSWLHSIDVDECDAYALDVWPGFESVLVEKIQRIWSN